MGEAIIIPSILNNLYESAPTEAKKIICAIIEHINTHDFKDTLWQAVNQLVNNYQLTREEIKDLLLYIQQNSQPCTHYITIPVRRGENTITVVNYNGGYITHAADPSSTISNYKLDQIVNLIFMARESNLTIRFRYPEEN